MTATFLTATTACTEDAYMGVDWLDDDLPEGPIEAVAEWLRRERCELCGSVGAGCVEVAIWRHADDDARELESIEDRVGLG